MGRATSKKILFESLLIIITLTSFSACTRSLGYGVLLWAVNDPPIPSGAVLPVYIKSNINQVWVVGIPQEYLGNHSKDEKFEIPLAKLELAGSKKKARKMAEEFAPYALRYAETLHDGLPIREAPENSARRVYRLRQGEIIKILSPAHGSPALGGSGDPLPGEWFHVLTENGTMGYCFSYRLSLFSYEGGEIASAPRETVDDPELDAVLSNNWVAQVYGNMLEERRIDLDLLYRRWGFYPGQDTGIARVFTGDIDRSFTYTGIRSTGTRSWRYEGTSLQMNLRPNSTLAVQFTDANGVLRTVYFVTIPASLDEIIDQETTRREELFNNMMEQGPEFTSGNFGTLTLINGGRFTWTDFDDIIPSVIPASALGNGNIIMKLFISGSLIGRYDGAFTFRFNTVNNTRADVDFLYAFNNHGLRLEFVPSTSRDGLVVSRRSSAPIVLNFSSPNATGRVPQENFPFVMHGLTNDDVVDNESDINAGDIYVDEENSSDRSNDEFDAHFFQQIFDDPEYSGSDNRNSVQNESDLFNEDLY